MLSEQRSAGSMNNAATVTRAAATLPPALREVGPVPLTSEARFLILPNSTNESAESNDADAQDNEIICDQLLVLPGANESTTEFNDFPDTLDRNLAGGRDVDKDNLVKQRAKRTPAGGATSEHTGPQPTSQDFSADPPAARPVACSTITGREFGSGSIKMDNNYVSIVPATESPAGSAPSHLLASSVPGPSSAARGAGPQVGAPSEPSELEPLAPPLLSHTGVVRMEPKLDMGWVQPMAQQQSDKSGISSSSRTPRATPRTTPRVTPRGNKVSPGIALLPDLLSTQEVRILSRIHYAPDGL